MDKIKYNHNLPIQLRFSDIDQFGHVNNTVYFSFYDLGKTDYFTSVCSDVNWNREAIMVVHIEVDFLEQIYGTDKVAVETAVTEIGNKSFKLSQQVVDQESGQVKCICKSIMVTYDLENHCSKKLTEEWIAAICSYEGKDLRRDKTKELKSL